MPSLHVENIARFIEPFRVEPGTEVVLGRDYDPTLTPGIADEGDAGDLLRQGVELLAEYQARLAAQDTYGVLLVLQGIDASGKDGTIRQVTSGINPQGVRVHSFKVPSAEELDHDFLWRYQQRLPGRGEIGIFNRSHYEEVLVVRVHPELLDGQKLPREFQDEQVWERRYRAINDWERNLVENGFPVLKLFLNVSKEEQRLRLLRRCELPTHYWKVEAGDVRERARWDDYQQAMSAMLSATSTPWAPWWVVPADHKWFLRAVTAAVLAQTLIELDPQFPQLDGDARQEMLDVKAQLEAQAPRTETAHA